MIIPGRRLFSPLLVAVYFVGLAGFALYTRAFVDGFAERYLSSFSYWDVVLELIGSGYVVCYWVIPVAVWCVLRQLQGSARADSLIRHATKTDWTLAQGLRALSWIALLVGGLLVVALAAGVGYPFTWAWGPISGNTDVLLQLPELARSQPVPVLSVVVQTFALTATLFALTLVIAAAATNLDRPRTPTVTAVALILWGVVSFRTEGWFSDVIGVATYALSWRADVALPFGSGSGVMVLLVAGALTYTSARWLELHGPRLSAVPAGSVAIILGAATLLGVAGTLPSHDQQPGVVTLMLLQGIGTDGVSILHYLASVILVLIPAIVAHRNLVASLSGRCYAEMIRLASPARWYGRQLGDATLFCAGYGLAMATWATLLVTSRLRTPPDYDSLLFASLWGLALFAQALLITVMLALGTVLVRRVEGGAYACVAALVLSWPLGAVSRWTPTGQASLVRMTHLSGSAPTSVQPLPLIVLSVWLIVLGATTLVLFNRTRGAIL